MPPKKKADIKAAKVDKLKSKPVAQSKSPEPKAVSKSKSVDKTVKDKKTKSKD